MTKQTEKLLPQDSHEAIKIMHALTLAVIESQENETNTLALNQGVDFFEASLQKLSANEVYVMAAKEFIARQNEFQKLKDPLLKELLAIQEDLKSAAKANMSLLMPVMKKAQKNITPVKQKKAAA